jgi:hypothetical protein
MVPGIEPRIHERMAVLDTALAPFSTGRRFFNFTSGADPSSAIGAKQLARLREIKHRRDPPGVIRSNRPVLPSGAEEGLASVG